MRKLLGLEDGEQRSSIGEEYEERNVLVANSCGREEKESGLGRDDRVQEATEEGAIEQRLWRVGERYW